MALGNIGLRPIQRTAKASREALSTKVAGRDLEVDVLGESATIIPFEYGLQAIPGNPPRTDPITGFPVAGTEEKPRYNYDIYEAKIRVSNLGASTIYLVWGSWPTDPAAPDVPPFSELPTLKIPSGDTREFSLGLNLSPFHVITGDGNPDSACIVDRFLQKKSSP